MVLRPVVLVQDEHRAAWDTVAHEQVHRREASLVGLRRLSRALRGQPATHRLATRPLGLRISTTVAISSATKPAAPADRWVLTMRRLLRHAPERVWPMLTEPDRLARWSPFVPDRTIDATGPATARENPGDPPREAEVLTFDPPHELVHRYGDDVLRWTLVAEDDGTLLTLEHSPRRQPAPVVDRLRLAHLPGHPRRDRGGRPGRPGGG